MGRNAAFDWAEVDWSKPNEQIMEELGCCIASVYYNRRRYAPDTKVIKDIDPRWANVDWSKPNKVIAKQVGCNAQLVTSYRKYLAKETVGAIRQSEKRTVNTYSITLTIDQWKALAYIAAKEELTRSGWIGKSINKAMRETEIPDYIFA